MYIRRVFSCNKPYSDVFGIFDITDVLKKGETTQVELSSMILKQFRNSEILFQNWGDWRKSKILYHVKKIEKKNKNLFLSWAGIGVCNRFLINLHLTQLR